MKMKILVPVMVALAGFFLCTTAWARGPTDSAEEEKAVRAARALFDEGVAAQQADDLKGAYDAFRKSFNLRPSYDTAANLGHVEAELGRFVDAATHLEFCIRTFPTGENQGLFQLAKKLYDETLPKVTSVVLTVDVAGASVLQNGTLVGTSPIRHPLFAEPGKKHVIRVEARDGRAESLEFQGRAGETLKLDVSLEDDGMAASKPAPGDQGSDVDDPSPSDPEPSRVRRNWVPAYVLGGVTVAAFGTSMVFKVLQGSQKDKMEELQSGDVSNCFEMTSDDCSSLEDTIARHKTYARVGDATLLAAGVGAALTIGYVTYVLLKRPPPVQAGLAFDKTGGMLRLQGSF